MLTNTARTWAEIDLQALAHNYRTVRTALQTGVRCMSVVKANAYGHGAVRCAAALEALGTDWFAVACLEEALQLRESGITRPILILSYTAPEEAAVLAEHRLTQTVINRDYAEALNQAAEAAGVTVTTHIKIDTGMSRVGFFCHEEIPSDTVIHDIAAVCRLPHLTAEGIYTHFTCADEPDGEATTRHQFACFTAVTEAIEKSGHHFSLRHCCNSAATLRFPEMQLDMVRPGIILYGCPPSVWMTPQTVSFLPVMSLRTVVAMTKPVPACAGVSYGETYRAVADSVLATVPIGYADGYFRCLSNKGTMLLHGCRVPLVGRVCMDQSILDVTALQGVHSGDTVTVFGTDGTATLSATEVAEVAGTISYELLCCIGNRVPRIFSDER